ncbi:hypothetical protein AAMO2058_000239000 [Amorphochlora amoebiformis]
MPGSQYSNSQICTKWPFRGWPRRTWPWEKSAFKCRYDFANKFLAKNIRREMKKSRELGFGRVSSEVHELGDYSPEVVHSEPEEAQVIDLEPLI